MLVRSNQIEPNEFINLIRDEELIIYEDIQGSKIWVNYVNDTWLIRPKSINQTPLNLIDMAVQKYYAKAYAYLLSLSTEVTDLLRPNIYFCFEYFPDEQPAHIKYERIPKNNLILTSICKYGKQYINDFNQLKVYANLFNVETLPLIYKGRLDDKQLAIINQFLHTDKEDLLMFFNETNFAKFFYNLLNPLTSNSFLNSDFQNNLEKLVIRFSKSQKEYTCEILNPLYQRMELKVDSEYADVYSILLFNFVQFLLTIDLEQLQIEGTGKDEIYINLICKLYNIYISKYEKNIIDFKFIIPGFFKSDKFKINQALIKDKTTLDYINKNNKLEYVFKIVLSSFQKQHKKPIGIIQDISLKHLNDTIKKVQLKIEDQFRYNSRLSKFAYQFKDLSQFPNIKWEQDNKGYVYPEIDSLFQKDVDIDKKIKPIK